MIKNTKNPQDLQISLFKGNEPLAYRIRPKAISEIIGQSHLLGENGILTNYLRNHAPYSVILWGPPGCGKTSIAFLAQAISNKEFIYLSGASTSVSELREVINRSKMLLGRVILFLDEIHRLAKNQQDVLLEPLESGHLTLIGTTTENTHISLTRALHSRVKVLELKPLKENDLHKLINRALTHPSGFPKQKITDGAVKLLIQSASGDARRLLFNLEEAANISKNHLIDEEIIQKILSNSQLQIGADLENHYNFISALQKSIRGSDPDAAIYWLARLLSGGADPVLIARRILVTASEDIGLADSNILTIAINAYYCAQFLGMPEARIPLAQAVICLACAPKSNTLIVSIDKALKDTQELSPYPVPVHLRNVGGEGYKYPPACKAGEARSSDEVSGRHSFKDARVKQNYLPDELIGKKYFEPNERDRITRHCEE